MMTPSRKAILASTCLLLALVLIGGLMFLWPRSDLDAIRGLGGVVRYKDQDVNKAIVGVSLSGSEITDDALIRLGCVASLEDLRLSSSRNYRRGAD